MSLIECPECKAKVSDTAPACPKCGYTHKKAENISPSDGVKRETKSSGVAILLSFFWTGLGQLYAGRIMKGLIMMGLTPVIWFTVASIVGAFFAAGIESKTTAGTIMGSVFSIGIVVIVMGGWWVMGMISARADCEEFNKRSTK